MGLFDKAVQMASKSSARLQQLAGENADTITDTVGKITAKIDEKTEGKHRDKLDKVEGAVEKAVRRDDGPGSAGGPDEPYHPTDPPGPKPAG